MKTQLHLLLILISLLFAVSAMAQCPTGDVFLDTQADVNAFADNNPDCMEVPGNLTINGDDITDLGPLAGLTSVGGDLRIVSNAALTTLSPLEGLTSLSGDLSIFDNDMLTTLSGLDGITSVGGDFLIHDNAALTTLSALEGITSVGGYLDISENDMLTTLSALEGITSVSGDLEIESNVLLTTLSGLDGITSVGGSLTIFNNAALTILSGLDGITSVGGDLDISNNAALTTLSGLAGLTSVGGDLDILNNAALTTLEGLENIDPESIVRLNISHNPQLSFCNLPNICTYLAGPGPRTISGNSGSCESEMDVEDSCQPEVVSIELLEDITVECPAPFPGLPLLDNVSVTYDDDNMEMVAINWQQGSYESTVGSYTLTGVPDLTAEENPEGLTASVNIHVEDTQPPVPDIAELPDLTGTCGVTISEIPTATDGCAGTITATTEDPLEYVDQGSYTITWTYDDGHGYTANQTQTVIVETTSTPEIACSETSIVTCDPVVIFDLPVAIGECGAVRVVQTDRTGLTSGSTFPVGTTVLTYRASNAAGSVTCTIEVEVLPELEVQHISGIQNGDTLHLEACIPPDISKADLDLGAHQRRSSLSRRIFSEDLPVNPEPGLWKISQYTYEVKDHCGNTESFENYVALYDLDPPVFRNFPQDITIDTPDDVPPVSEDVRIIDICRYMVWDTVITSAVVDPESKDTIAFVRRWMSEDEVGNRSFRDQMINIEGAGDGYLGGLTAHIVKESDLIDAHFPGSAGTDGIPFTLYRLDSNALTTTLVDSTVSGNWQGSRGKVFFTPLPPGSYRVKVEVPEGYVATDADSVIHVHGWSDTFQIIGGINQDLGSILLVPGSDTLTTDTMTLPIEPDTAMIDAISFPSYESGFETTGMVSRRNAVHVYPNPTTGRIKIGMPSGKYFDFTIINHLGQSVLKGMAENGSEIELSGQVNGIYFILIKNEKEFIETKRILLLQGR